MPPRHPTPPASGSTFEPDPFASQELPWSLVAVKEAGATKAAWMGARDDQREPLGPRPGGEWGACGCPALPPPGSLTPP